MKEVGSLGKVHGSQFSYSLLCKSLKFYIKPCFFLMAIYAITTYSYVINMCVCLHMHSQGAESPAIEAVVPILTHVVHMVRTSRALKSISLSNSVATHDCELILTFSASGMGAVATEHISSALRLSAARLHDPLHSLSRSQSLFCAQLLMLSVETAK